MLTAYSGMPSREFIAQLRNFVIAFSCAPAVVDCVDNLIGADEEEDTHALEIQGAEEQAEKRGRESMKDEMISVLNRCCDPPLNQEMMAVLEEIEA